MINREFFGNRNISEANSFPDLMQSLNPCSAAPGYIQIAETHRTAAPGYEFFFFSKTFNGKDSDMFVVIVGQFVLLNVQFNAWKLVI